MFGCVCLFLCLIINRFGNIIFLIFSGVRELNEDSKKIVKIPMTVASCGILLLLVIHRFAFLYYKLTTVAGKNKCKPKSEELL